MDKANLDQVVKVVAGAEGCRRAVQDGAVAVMVDALRASATITSLVQNGARRVWVATRVAQARDLARELGDALLVGERRGFPPPGFDAGNSPEGVAGLQLDGRDVVFTSTTGAARLGQLEGAPAVLVGGPVNLASVARAASAHAGNRPIYAIAAGLTGRPGGTEEDWLGAALVAQELARDGRTWSGRHEGEGRHWPGGEIVAEAVARLFAAAPNGRGLQEKGLGEDVEACSRVDWLDAVARVAGYRRIDDGPPLAELVRDD